MSLRLERSAETLVVVALAAVMLALFPAVAEAQTGEKGTSIVVRPGDSLWSISEERLGPEATPQEVLRWTGRLYALNRALIGPDPDLIFVGQRLSLPRAMGLSGRTRPAEGTAPPTRAGAQAEGAEAEGVEARTEGAKAAGTRGTERATQATAHADVGTPPRAAGTTRSGNRGANEGLAVRGVPRATGGGADAGRDDARAAQAPGARAEGPKERPDARPDGEAADPDKRAAPVEAASPSEPDARGRRLLGAGVLALTLASAALIALSGTRGRRGMAGGYRGRNVRARAAYPAAYPVAYPVAYPAGGPSPRTPDPHPGPSEEPQGDEEERAARRAGAPVTPGRGRHPRGPKGKPNGRPNGRPVPRSGLALGAHNPKIRRAPLRARAALRKRSGTRPRGRQS